MISITFLGAARTVTGSKYLVESNGTRIMVDSGLFQGLKELRERNWQDLPVPASSIEAIVLTHAHLDHCGYLPRLVSQGFRGRVFCTQGTQDLCKIVLPDAGRLQEEDAAFANRHGFSKHKPALPLYTRGRRLPRRVAAAAVRLRPADAGRGRHRSGLHQRRSPARLVLRADADRRTDHPLRRRPRTLWPAGPARSHAGRREPTTSWSNPPTAIACTSRTTTAIASRRSSTTTAKKGGKLIVPAFAIGRVEELIYWLKRLETEKRIPVLPVFVDSPMAAAALARYTERVHELDPEMQPEERDDKAPHDAAAPHPADGPPAPGDAGARDVRVLHRAVPRHRQRRRSPSS